jgi:DNA-binding transcriptional ArsR family regulator
MRQLPKALRQEIAFLSFLYGVEPPSFLLPRAGDEDASFDDELGRMLALGDDVLELAMSRTVVNASDSEALGRARRAFAPRALAERFAALLESYWEVAFAEEWDRIAPRLVQAVVDARRRVVEGTLNALLETLSPTLRIEHSTERFAVDLPTEHTLEITADRPLVLVPSAYVWPHLFCRCEEPWPAALVYPAPFVADDARPRVPDDELLRRLKALADDTRLRTLGLIAERPRSTKELAPLLPISEAGLSRHLHQLADAGLVHAQREGYYVVYSLAEGSASALSHALRKFLDGSR